ncbi:MAG TPA: hypothetical protein DCQ51_05345 [Planktothrix sp. UBA8407]|nr:hypothetical protein [Planktothrix sp. UBA8407]
MNTASSLDFKIGKLLCNLSNKGNSGAGGLVGEDDGEDDGEADGEVAGAGEFGRAKRHKPPIAIAIAISQLSRLKEGNFINSQFSS